MSLTKEETILLMEKIQKGIATPREERRFLLELETRYKPHKLTRYIYDADELKAEFLCEAWNAIYRTNLTIGDPIMFCIVRGNGAMLDYYKKMNATFLTKICPNCNSHVSHDKRNSICKICGEEYISNYKEDIIPTEDFDQKFSNENFVNHVEMNILLNDIINIIKKCDLEEELKDIIVYVLTMKINFNDYTKSIGKTYKWRKKTLNSVLSILKDNDIELN